jgi:Zn-dependent peptidase ImmA (M78 family)
VRAEQGEQFLTLRQAERAAATYARPLAALFLPEPPAEEPQETQFRSLPGAPEPPWPPEMVVLSRQVRQRQDAAAELLDLLDEAPRWQDVVSQIAAVDRRDLPRIVRRLLGIGIDEQMSWRDPAGYKPLRNWLDAVEGLGIFVMQNGDLPLEVMRGFAATDSSVPAIIVNTQDDPRARAFTTLHELGHLILSTRGELVNDWTEAWCNDFAGEVMVPEDALRSVHGTGPNGDPLSVVDDLALTFGVTPLAAAVRLARVKLISQSDANTVIDEIRARPGRRTSGGGDYYRTQIGRLGPSFVRLVFMALDSQALTYPTAASLLRVKVNNFDALRDYVGQRMPAS